MEASEVFVSSNATRRRRRLWSKATGRGLAQWGLRTLLERWSDGSAVVGRWGSGRIPMEMVSERRRRDGKRWMG